MNKIENAKINKFCPTLNFKVDIPIRYIQQNGAYILVDTNGCDEGYNGSEECKQCVKRCIERFKSENER